MLHGYSCLQNIILPLNVKDTSFQTVCGWVWLKQLLFAKNIIRRLSINNSKLVRFLITKSVTLSIPFAPVLYSYRYSNLLYLICSNWVWIMALGCFVNVTFCQRDILSTSHFFNVPFHQLDNLSSSLFVNWPFCYLTVYWMLFCQLTVSSTCLIINLLPL
jgi:hypothetical protein